ncbi:MAG: aminotransferase class I/II-fold pyridoxal phosphate-dependent enzyme [Brevefilum fermentans]|jgi:LL-diaminopimelate aminotransferase|uniref:Aminotransferase n=1 Tax=Candidatus Brevifilum fermentans TaxID=1986204 RepID=A0A1Y6K646_9CHLR|nr:aminotransferase class I/II-fold pyridoxal phosphate-dependent enzyme [Brevefilum fermentans]MDI9566131.1 aminotransferase class I/II-fold pyridoxal phosphate-dependent enzyme [Chloroflexota bacterium]SMX54317.1 LL-diaminopimelate aminotransferase [Brevefilum fermentans]
MEIKPAQRISSVKPYFFADLEKTIAKLKQSGLNIIRLDMGSPDLPPADNIIETLVNSARRSDVHGYGPSGGSVGLKSAFAKYYEDRFGVELDPEREVLTLIGSKEGIYNINQVLIDPGDVVLLPDPCYPVYRSGVMISQGQSFSMPLLAENGFLPDLERIPEDVAQKAKLMWLNYPNNPTGAIAPLSFFQKVVDFATKYNIVVAHDAPYVDVCFDDYIAPSILQIPGAKDVCIEFNSLSKTYNMAGWRVGVAVGNPEIVRLLRLLKSQMDSSLFVPIMLAAEAALLEDQSWIRNRNLVYQRRRDIVVKTMEELGFTIENPKAALYVWAGLPNGWKDDIEFCDVLLRETGVSITPGVVYGDSGAGYVRISLVIPAEKLVEAMLRLKDWIKERE